MDPATKAFLSFVITAINAAGQVVSDGKLSISSVIKLFQTLELAVPALKDVKSIPGELANLSPSDKADLEAMVNNGISLPSGQASQVVDEALKVAITIAQVLAQFWVKP